MASPALDAAGEDEADPVRAANVEVLADDLFEEHPPGERPVEDLGEGELGLQHREVIAVAGPAIRGAEGVGQAAQPLADEGVDLGGVEAVADALQPTRVFT